MTQTIDTRTAAVAAKAGIAILSRNVEEDYYNEPMARVVFVQDGEEFEALEHYCAETNRIATSQCHMDHSGIYNRTRGTHRFLFWDTMSDSEYADAQFVRLAIHAAMKGAILEDRYTQKAA